MGSGDRGLEIRDWGLEPGSLWFEAISQHCEIDSPPLGARNTCTAEQSPPEGRKCRCDKLRPECTAGIGWQ